MKRNKELLLRSQISISYWAIIVIGLFFTIMFVRPLFKMEQMDYFNIAYIIIFVFGYLSIYLIIKAKIILFYQTHIVVKYIWKNYSVQYSDLETMTIYHNPMRFNMSQWKSDNDVIKLISKDGRKLFISQFQYDNYYAMRTLIRKMIR